MPNQFTLIDPHELDEIEDRLRQLKLYTQGTSYLKQKDSLQKELKNFLLTLPGSLNLDNVTPANLCRFLVFKDRHGKTQIHQTSCRMLGYKNYHNCGRPLRLSYKTIDEYFGKMVSIFHTRARDGE